MKRLRMSVLGIFCCLSVVAAQNSPDCRSAIPVCADSALTWVADGSGDVDDFDPDIIRQTGCLEKGSNISANIENNTSWFVFRAGTDGQIGFDIEALPSATGIITAEWDFALYGPDVDCASISSGDAQPIRCNYEVNNTAYTGIGVNPENGQEGAPFVKGSQNTYDEWLGVQAGEVYYLLINNYNTNFDGDPEAFTLTFTGSSVDADQNNALDCTLRDEFLGLDIAACIGDPDIVLSALNSPAGPDIANVTWSLDADGDGVPDRILAEGPTETTYTVSSPNSGRYFVEILTGTAQTYTDADVLSELSDSNDVEIVVMGGGDYEYAVNGGPFQDSPVFTDLPPGQNTVVVNDTNGCGATAPIPFLLVGYPKFFTPNGDGIHDRWNIQGIETLTDPAVFIFDRYGKLLRQ
ncbi:MAG: T9SS type B sorting domain-containing protein [Robiginitalea sp.]